MQTIAQKQALVTVHKRVKRVHCNNGVFIEQVATWLEAEDTKLTDFFAYGICIASGMMLTSKVLSLLF